VVVIGSTKLADLRKPGYLLGFAFILLLIACSPGRKSQTSVSHIAYHDLTARYNRYFNAKLILQETHKFFKDSHKEDYTQLLPLYLYGSEAQAQSVYGDMDEVIKKASANIMLHENSKWTDDAYMHIGMAYFLKQDYAEAVKAFTFVTSEIEQGVRLKERKKGPKRNKKSKTRAQREKERNTNEYYDESLSFLKHKPARYEASIWIVKSYTELKAFDKAQSVLSLVKGDRKFPNELKEDLAVAGAHLAIKRKDYQNAIFAMKDAVALSDNKKRTVRYYFILAQLHELLNQNVLAINYLQQVIDGKPPFEMEFHAKLKIAQIAQKEDLQSDSEVIAMLLDMLKSERYRMFRGEIHYTLGEIYQKQKRDEEAIEQYLAAVEHFETEQDKQARTFLKLANLYFAKEDYVVSQKYHDSTLALINERHTEYDKTNKRNNILKDLVLNLNTIAEQDSLQALAAMSPEELETYLRDLKRQQEAQQKGTDQVEEEFFEPLFGQEGQQGTSSWPFDDPGLRGKGFNEFKRMWGNRPYADNWRIGKQGGFVLEDGDRDNDGDAPGLVDQKGNIDTTLLPTSPEALATSNEKLMDAYYALGVLYKDKLNNIPKSTEAFETLMKRFPGSDNKYRLEASYHLYLLYQGTDAAKAEKYRNIIINEFPESILAKVLMNPNYLKESRAVEDELNTYYASTYTYFTNNDLGTALQRKFNADTIYPGNFLQPKFDMLEALIYGKQGEYDRCKAALQTIVNKYPFDEVKPQALTMLNMLEGREYAGAAGNMEANTYEFQPQATHFMVVLLKKPGTDIAALQNRIASFNDKYFRLAPPSISPIILDNETELILLKKYDNAEKAKQYYNTFRYNPEVFVGLEKEDYDVFYISERNYGVFFRQRDLVNYMAFFTTRYLRED
jgi:tetratricopeptide (TPR) repeat protein